MEDLPNEICDIILKKLDINDKLSCRKACINFYLQKFPNFRKIEKFR